MDKVLNILYTLIFICLVLLDIMSIFVWHNMFCSIMFSAGILVWMWGVEGANDLLFTIKQLNKMTKEQAIKRAGDLSAEVIYCMEILGMTPEEACREWDV